MIATLLFLLLQINPIIQLNVGDSVQLKPLTPGQSFLPVGTAQTCVALQGSTVTAIWPGECGVNVFSQDANGNWTVSQYPLTFHVPSFETALVVPSAAMGPGLWQNWSVSTLIASDNLRSATSSTNFTAGRVTFAFNLPPTATVIGIEVEAEMSTSQSGQTADLLLSLSSDGGVNYTATKQHSQSNITDAVYMFGGKTDTWGRTWSVSELQQLKLKVEGRVTAGAVRVDQLKAKVYYF